MESKHWFIGSGVSLGIWVMAMGQSWSIVGWLGWQMLLGFEYSYLFIAESTIARVLTFVLVGFTIVSLFKGFTSLKQKE